MKYNMNVFYSQAPCDNGSKIQNYILQWDEVLVYFSLRCRDLVCGDLVGLCRR